MAGITHRRGPGGVGASKSQATSWEDSACRPRRPAIPPGNGMCLEWIARPRCQVPGTSVWLPPNEGPEVPQDAHAAKKFHKPEVLTWQFSSSVALPGFLVALHVSTICAIAWPRPVSFRPGNPWPGSRDRKSRAVPWPRRRSSRLGSLTFFLFHPFYPVGLASRLPTCAAPALRLGHKRQK